MRHQEASKYDTRKTTSTIRPWAFCSSDSAISNLLFRKIGIVVAPLHFDVCAVLLSEGSSSSSSSVNFGVLFANVETFPPLRMRRRLVPMGPGKFILGGILAAAAADAIAKDERRERDIVT
jgi:hypothetical protein